MIDDDRLRFVIQSIRVSGC